MRRHLVLIAAVAAAAAVSGEWVMAEREPEREPDVVARAVGDRADLLMRALDTDHDRLVSAESVDADVLAEHLPGVSVAQMASFIETADTNGDGMLDRDELVNGVAGGLATGQYPEMLEVEALRRRKGFFKSIVKGVKSFGKQVLGNVKEKTKTALRRATGQVDDAQDACVMCQYIIERLETNVRQSGVIPSMPTGDVPLYVAQGNDNPFAPFTPAPGAQAPAAPAPSTSGPAASSTPKEGAANTGGGTGSHAAEEGHTSEGAESFVETGASDPYDAAAAGIISATRESTRVQRQMERQKYNEIYRVVDVTLDDVCEQSMPSAFYGYCKQIYHTQHDVVEGLRYQYRPADICFRVGMCGKTSYITKGIHSRYK